MKITKQDLVNILTATNAESVEVQTYSVAKMNKTRIATDENGNELYEEVTDKRGNITKKVVKEHNPLEFDRVFKETTIVYGFGKSYEERVNEALVENGKEGEFKSSPLKWGSWVKGSEGKVIAHTKDGKDKLYMRCYLIEESKQSETTYYVNGSVATIEQIGAINKFSPELAKKSKKQESAGLEQEKQIVVNVVDFNTIVWIKIDGVTYELN